MAYMVRGLQDIRGRQVYEGDSVKCENYKMYPGDFVVMYDTSTLQWVGKKPNVFAVPLCEMRSIEVTSDPQKYSIDLELLEALKGALVQYEEDTQADIDSHHAFFGGAPDFEKPEWVTPEWVDRARAAISKAESTTL